MSAAASNMPDFSAEKRRVALHSMVAAAAMTVLKLAAGLLSVAFYRRGVPGGNLTAGLGSRLGALSGMIGFGIFSLLTALETLIFRSGGELRAALLQAVDQAAARNSEPQAQQMLEYLKSPQGLAVVMVMGFIVMFFLFLVLSTLGGVLGAALLRRKGRA